MSHLLDKKYFMCHISGNLTYKKICVSDKGYKKVENWKEFTLKVFENIKTKGYVWGQCV